jgi:hypothetical protein
VKLPRNVSPAAAERRSLLIDALLGVLIALSAIVVAAGIGVVGFFALLCILLLLGWLLVERAARIAARGRRRRDVRSGRWRSWSSRTR